MIIRPEKPSDCDAITTVTTEAFKDVPFSRQTEPFIVKALRRAEALSLSLVADIDAQVVGHIAFSPITVSDGTANWYTLGPISVKPAFQKQGIGSALVEQGLLFLKENGGQGCMLVGNPDYYGRFGFVNGTRLQMDDVPPEVVLALSFSNGEPDGKVTLHSAFGATE